MSEVKQDPHAAGYAYQPIYAVTANFPKGVEVAAVRYALAIAGFPSDQIQVFQGPTGADELDLTGQRHGGWVLFRRKLERAFQPYETSVLNEAEEFLRSDGTVIVVSTGGDDARKSRAVALLESSGGRNVRYWAPSSTEIYF